MTIAVVDWRPLNKGCLHGVITLEVAGGFIIHDFKLFEKDGRRWINLPDREYKTKAGESKYAPVVEIPDRKIERQFQQDVLAALDLYLKGANGAE